MKWEVGMACGQSTRHEVGRLEWHEDRAQGMKLGDWNGMRTEHKAYSKEQRQILMFQHSQCHQFSSSAL